MSTSDILVMKTRCCSIIQFVFFFSCQIVFNRDTSVSSRADLYENMQFKL